MKTDAPLRKHAYSNILKILQPKKGNFWFKKKKSDIFHISAQNKDRKYPLESPGRGGSNGYPGSMFVFLQNKKNNVYPCKPQFYYIKVGFQGKNYIGVILYCTA